MRLCVDQTGTRVRDEQINVLTMVANEAYAKYVETYQREIADEYRAEIEARYGKPIGELSDDERLKIAEEYGEGILPPPPRQAGARKAKLRKERALSPEFRDLWERIKHRTRYAVKIDTEKLLQEVVPELDQAEIAPPRVTITRAQFRVDDDGIFEAMQTSAAKTAVDVAGRYPLPNLVEIMSNLMEHTTPPVRLTRRTLREVFSRTKTKQQAVENPHEWCAKAVQIIKEKLADHLVTGIEYTKVSDLPGADALSAEAKWYEMQQILDAPEVELFAAHIGEANDPEKALYDLIPCDSKVETAFVEQLEERNDVKVYLKLPSWFTVPTPVGDYNPDWAIVMNDTDDDGRPILYLVTETKSSTNKNDLHPDEWRKILCGAAHFGSKQSRIKRTGALTGVEYKVTTNANELR